MLKNDLVLALSEMDYYKNQAGAVINDVFRVIAEALTKGEKVTIRGFGTFEVKKRKGVVFRPGDNLKDAVKTQNPNKLSLLAKTEKK